MILAHNFLDPSSVVMKTVQPSPSPEIQDVFFFSTHVFLFLKFSNPLSLPPLSGVGCHDEWVFPMLVGPFAPSSKLPMSLCSINHYSDSGYEC